MRLINTSTLELQDFIGRDLPEYAILSHRWENEEVSFQDFQNGSGLQMAGYSKIKKCCEQAARDGWSFAWVDSCCIDKQSSAELSEAINSMFNWYQEAQVCYAYLCDVPTATREQHHSEYSFFRQSKWFLRGWTLQELLAPAIVVFYDQAWVEIGTKSTLRELLSLMFWAARRETTRIEDEAYCLMGLFDVNMPTLYGEGGEAFTSLQLEILKKTDDESIFAWFVDSHATLKYSIRYTGLLAPSPQFFKDSGDVAELQSSTYDKILPYETERHPYRMTNKGLQISLPLIPLRSFNTVTPILLGVDHWTRVTEDESKCFVAPINAKIEGQRLRVAILLCKTSTRTFQRFWATDRALLDPVETKATLRFPPITTVYVKEIQKAHPAPYYYPEISLLTREEFSLSFPWCSSEESFPAEHIPATEHDAYALKYDGKPVICLSNWGCAALMFTNIETSKRFVIIIGVRDDQPGVNILILKEGESLEETMARVTRNIKHWTSHIFHYGRMCKSLDDKSSVLLSLKQGTRNGRSLYSVIIDTDPGGSLPWPIHEIVYPRRRMRRKEGKL